MTTSSNRKDSIWYAHHQAIWFLKCRSLTKKIQIDDLEIDEEGIADLVMDENNTATAARPGTSLNKPTSVNKGAMSQLIRPISSSGRPVTGYARPGTYRPVSGNGGEISNMIKTRQATANRPITSGGRLLRLGTASLMQQEGGQFINAEKLNAKSACKSKSIARVL